jgi:putative molybdopterin biosynthesis protein
MLHVSIEYKLSKDPSKNWVKHPLVELLERVNTHGSIGAAAKSLGRSYRYVWGELKFWESELNTRLIVWGRTSKGAELTPHALQFISAFSETHVELEPHVAVIKRRVQNCMSVLKNGDRSA